MSQPGTTREPMQSDSLFPLGIKARLAASFAAVIVLAATANFIARQTVSIVLWREKTATAAVVAPATRPVTAPAAPPAPLPYKSTEGLAYAADRYERACQGRAQTGSAGNDSEYFAAKDALRRAIADYALGMAPTTHTSALAQRGASFLERGQQFVHVADERRVARNQLSKVSQAMNDRMQAALNGAWKVFGRVIARQSLMELNADLAAMRHYSDSVIEGDELDADGRAALVAGETAFSALLGANESKFAKSESPEWTAKMKTDFTDMVKFRASLEQLNGQYTEDVRRFSQAHGSFFSAINLAALAEPVEQTAHTAAPPATPAAASTPSTAPSPAPLDATPDVVPAVAPPQHNGTIMAAVTAIVLLLVTAISVITVVSIVRPVKRIIRAATQLADGTPGVPVPRGGIKELDLLADAFNGMASRLLGAQEVSRTQQISLEEKVLDANAQTSETCRRRSADFAAESQAFDRFVESRHRARRPRVPLPRCLLLGYRQFQELQ